MVRQESNGVQLRKPGISAASENVLRELSEAAVAHAAMPDPVTRARLVAAVAAAAGDPRPEIRDAVSWIANQITDAAPSESALLEHARGGDRSIINFDGAIQGLQRIDESETEAGRLRIALHALADRETTRRPLDAEPLIAGVGRGDESKIAEAAVRSRRSGTPARDAAAMLCGTNVYRRIVKRERVEWQAAGEGDPVAADALQRLRGRIQRSWAVERLPRSLMIGGGIAAGVLFLGFAFLALRPAKPIQNLIPEPEPREVVVKPESPLPPCRPDSIPEAVVIVDASGLPYPAAAVFKEKVFEWVVAGMKKPAKEKDAPEDSDYHAVDFDTLPATVPPWAFAKPPAVDALVRGKLLPDGVKAVVFARVVRASPAPLTTITVYRIRNGEAAVSVSAVGEVAMPLTYAPVPFRHSLDELIRRTAFPDAAASRLIAETLAAWSAQAADAELAAAMMIRSAASAQKSPAVYERARDVLRTAYASPTGLTEKGLRMLALLESDEGWIGLSGRERGVLDPVNVQVRYGGESAFVSAKSNEQLRRLAEDVITAAKGGSQ